MSSRLLLAVEPRALAPRREGLPLALLKLWLVPEQERHKGGSCGTQGGFYSLGKTKRVTQVG